MNERHTKNKKKLNVALVVPALSGHEFRGVGVYTKYLFQSLQKQTEIDVSLLNIKDNIWRFDLVHFPFFDPFFLTLPFLKKKPTVVTIHDLIPLNYPQHFPPGLKGGLKWQIQKRSLNNCQAIITDSQASKNDIISLTHVKKSKIHIVYLGVGSEFRVISNQKKLDEVKKKLNLPKNDFILHVGDVNYNKNILGLIKAFAKVTESEKNINLVLVGKGFVKNTSQLEEVNKLIKSLNLDSKVYKIGYVDISDLVCIYNLAKLYAQVSFAEGFGLPVLEAMSLGVPVVCANTSSLPEIVGDAGILVDPTNIDNISQKIIEVLRLDKTKLNDIKDSQAKRAREFTWERCAKKTVKVYKQVSDTN